MKIILQDDETTCGAACLASVAAHFGYRNTVNYFASATHTTKEGCGTMDIISAAGQIGLSAEQLTGSPGELLESICSGDVKFPFIAHTLVEGHLQHFMTVYALKTGRFAIMDPAIGKRTMTLEHFFEIWTGYIVVLKKTDRFKNADHRYLPLRIFKPVLKASAATLVKIGILTLTASAASIITAYLFQSALNRILQDAGGSFNILDVLLEMLKMHTLGQYCMIAFLIGAVGLLLSFVRDLSAIRLSTRIDENLNQLYIKKLLRMPLEKAAVFTSGDYLTRLTDIENIQTVITQGFLTLTINSAMSIACGILLAGINSTMFLISLVTVVCYSLVIRAFLSRIESGNRKVMASVANKESLLKEIVEGLETVKATGSEYVFEKRFNHKTRSMLDNIYSLNRLGSFQILLSSLIEHGGTMLVLGIGFILTEKHMLTVGTLITFNTLFGYFAGPLLQILELQPVIQKAAVSASRLDMILNAEQENKIVLEIKKETAIGWYLDNVSYCYSNGVPVFENIRLLLPKGSVTVIKGESGCGKTTLAKILAGLYSPTSGHVSADGKQVDMYWLRKETAYVSQDNFLFSGSIRDNLMCEDKEKVNKILDICCLRDFIDRLPFGLDSIITENGVNLSGGQRQRLCIARALLKDPKLLILDEAMSHLDETTAQKVLDNILDLDCTCLIITHQNVVHDRCGKQYVFKNGVLEESC